MKGIGYESLQVIRGQYYQVPFDKAFVDGKPTSKVPDGSPVVNITKYAQDPD